MKVNFEHDHRHKKGLFRYCFPAQRSVSTALCHYATAMYKHTVPNVLVIIAKKFAVYNAF